MLRLTTIGVAMCMGSGVLVGVFATEASAVTFSISGSATNAPSQSCVFIETNTGGVVGSTTTGVGGVFSVSVSSGTYLVQVDPSCFGQRSVAIAGAYYEAGASPNATSVLTSATPVDVTTADATSVNLTLSTGDTLNGTVNSGAGGTAAGVCVYLFNGTDSWDYQGLSTTGGGYTVTGIAPDAANGYQIEFDPSCGGSTPSTLAPTFYANQALEENDTPFVINSPSQTINVTVPVGGTINGTARQPNGSVASNVCVDVISSDADESYFYTVETGPSGTYSFPGLAATAFNVTYDPGCASSQLTDFSSGETTITFTSPITSTVDTNLLYSGSTPSILPTAATTGTVGSAFVQSFSTSGGIAPFTWSATSLPAGLFINSTSGVVSGTPTTSGALKSTITAQDSSTQAVAISQSVTFNINSLPTPVTTTTTSPSTTPTTIPQVPPAPKPKVSVAISNVVLQKATSASIPVSCAAATCTGTVNPDGSPQVSVVWIGVEGDEIVIGHLGQGRKVSNIGNDPRVALTVEADGANAVGMANYLIIHGSAHLVEGGAPELLQRLAEVYVGPGVKFPSMDNPPAGQVIHIVAERFGGVGPWANVR